MQSANPTSSPAAPAPARKAKRRRYPHSFWWYLKWFFNIVALLVLCATCVVAAIGKSLYDELQAITPDVRVMQVRNKAEPTRIYAADKTLLAEFKGEQRDWIPLDSLKVQRKRNGKTQTELGHLINATLSIEDARFYTHPGMDAYRIAGAAVANYRNRDGIQQGGSTITEQLAVNVYLTRTKTFARRLQTALLALQLEKRFSKDEILELYLNEIYYGNRAYGAEAAAHTYFNRSARSLTISQAAFLAGLPQQPARLDPFKHFERAKKRQKLVLRAMLENKKINWGQYLEAVKDPTIQNTVAVAKARMMAERRETQKWRSPYFVSYVKQYLQRQYQWSDEFLNKSGLKIYTTLDPKIQAVAETVMRQRLNSLGSNLQGALVCIDPWSGHVLGMYGGRDYYDKKTGEFNRATQARRQPGSTFKPYVYATAMETGLTPDSRVVDKPYKIWGKRIKNYDYRNRGSMTFRTALAISNNVAATRILMGIGTPNGIQNVVQKAHMMGIQSPLVPVPSLALGASEVTLLEHTSAFGVFATRGLRAEQTPVERVENYAGETLMEHTHPVDGARVLSPEAGDRMWDMLRYVVTNGTGKIASIGGVDVIGKTGTTSSNKDVWFMGATRQLACGVWIGYDKPRDLGGGSAGGAWCAPAWRRFMVRALDIWSNRNPIEKMVEDARATQQRRLLAAQYKRTVRPRICRESGLLGTSNCPDTFIQEFSAAGGATGGAPTQYCDIHRASTPREGTLNDGSSGVMSDEGRLDDEARDAFGDPPARRENIDTGRDNARDDGQSTLDGEVVPKESSPDDNSSDAPARRDDESGERSGRAQAPSRRVGARPAVREEVAYQPDDNAPQSSGDDEVVATTCAESGELARGNCPVTMQQFFAASDVPRRRCSLHRR